MSEITLRGKTALITGGAGGIGRATALLFAREGAAISIADLDAVAGQNLAREIIGAGGRAIFECADVARAAECSRAVERTVREFGGIDVLFNNAGIIRRASVIEMSEQDWDMVMTVNVKSIFFMSREVIPIMAKAGHGSIVNTASGWGLAGGPRAAAYCASKGAVVLLSKAMAIDHGRQNIRVNCICPGDTDTVMLRREARQIGEEEDRFLSNSANRPLGRIGRPEEIAQAALYLAGDQASFVTGTALWWMAEVWLGPVKNMRLKDKVAIITGGTSGIGEATALLFAKEGANVAISGRNEERGHAVAEKILHAGGKAIFVRSDIRIAAECRHIVDETLRVFGGLDILFNNAGVFYPHTILDCSEEEWDLQMDINLKGTFLMSKMVLPGMIERRHGVIINNSSGWGIAGGDAAVAYCASKGGVVLLTKAMAIDHGRQGIRVNCICPGDVDTPMLPEDARMRGLKWDDYLAGCANRPMGRIGTTDEIAKAALFLASDDSSFMTGTALVVDGGGLAD